MVNPIKRFCKWYFSRNTLPYWCILAIDCLCILFPGFLAYYFKWGGDGFTSHFWPMTYGLLISLVVYANVFYFFHTYRGVLRFSSFVDLGRIALAVVIGCIVVCALHQLQVHLDFSHHVIFPGFRECLTIGFMGTLLMWFIRILVKTAYDTMRVNDMTRKAFIYGTLSGGIALAKSIRNATDAEFSLAGFVTTDKDMNDSWIMGKRVYADNSDLPDVMKKVGASVLLISPLQVDSFRDRSELIDALIQAHIHILMMPPAEEWDGKSSLSHSQLREVDIEDLLPREKIEVDMNAIGHLLSGHRILITGAAGSIGSEMSRQVAKYEPSELILVDQAETPMHDVRRYMTAHHKDLNVWTIVGDICNPNHMEQIFSAHRPDYVFHAAAYKHVPMMEDNPAIAVQNNVYGTRVIADLAVKYGTKKFVMISTDKAVDPTNVMGCSKRICEIYCQSLNAHLRKMEAENPSLQGGAGVGCQFITTRFGNVLGSNGSVIPIFREQIKNGGPVTVTHPDIIRFFMLIPEACRLVLEAGTMGKGGEIFVFDMGKPVRIADLAQRMINLSGVKDVKIEYTGLRDGEKLYEEVLNDKEVTMPTPHPKIMVAQVREYPYEEALANEQELYDLSFGFDDMAIVSKMKAIVPEYKSQNSKYAALD